MDTNQKIQHIISTVQDHCGLKDLVFGCKVTPLRDEYRGFARTQYVTNTRNVSSMRGTTCEVYEGYENGTGILSYESHLDLKILGKEPELQHLLKTIELLHKTTRNQSKIGEMLGFSCGDCDLYFDPNLGGIDGYNLELNLRQNLEQSEELTEFIYSLFII
jgi:hypothetical protein